MALLEENGLVDVSVKCYTPKGKEKECASLRGGTGLVWRGRRPAAVLCQRLEAFPSNLRLPEPKPEVAPLKGLCPQGAGDKLVESAYRARPLRSTRSSVVGLPQGQEEGGEVRHATGVGSHGAHNL